MAQDKPPTKYLDGSSRGEGKAEGIFVVAIDMDLGWRDRCEQGDTVSLKSPRGAGEVAFLCGRNSIHCLQPCDTHWPSLASRPHREFCKAGGPKGLHLSSALNRAGVQQGRRGTGTKA